MRFEQKYVDMINKGMSIYGVIEQFIKENKDELIPLGDAHGKIITYFAGDEVAATMKKLRKDVSELTV